MQDAKTTQILFDTAQNMGLKPEIITPSGMIAIQVNGQERYLFRSYSHFNNPLTVWLSQNKFATRTVLARNGLPNIPYMRTDKRDEAIAFLNEHTRIIAKPVKGMGSENIKLIDHEGQITDVSNNLIFEKYIKGVEMRYLVLDGVVIAVHKKQYDSPINDPNTVKRISYLPEAWNQQTCELAIRTTSALGLRLAAIDYMVTEDGASYTLEANSRPGIERFMYPTEGPGVNLAELFVKSMIEQH